MKKNEIALLIIIVSIALILSYTVFNALLGNRTSKQAVVKKTDPISETITTPSDKVFNGSAINPTVKIRIGNQNDQQPFTINQ